MDDTQRMKRLSKAKTKLILDQPFIGNIALGLKFSIRPDMVPPTAGTNGYDVFFHPDFMDKLNDDELLFLVAHEVFHPMFLHCTRRGNRDPLKWNIAADFVINQMLVEDNIGKQIQGTLYDPALYAKGEGMTDKIYDLLPQPKPNPDGSMPMPGDGSPGSSIDNCSDATGNPAEAESEMRVAVAQAAQAAKMAGKLSAAQARLAGELINPKVPWQDVLQRFVVKCRTDVRSWARPNRRFITQGLMMPSISGETMGPIVIGVDCSGSITDKILEQFATEITAIHEDCKPVAIHVVYFDSEVCHYDVFSRDDELSIAPHGGGGTAFSPIFRHVDEHDIEPVCCVVLTDLYCSDFGEQPEYPVLWVSNGTDQAPWGEVVSM